MPHLYALRIGLCALLSAVGLLLAAPVAHAQAPAWQRAVAVGVGATSISQVNATTTDAAGNVYVVGYFNETASFGNITLTSNGAFDAFVAKWSPVTGTYVWALQMGGTQVDFATAVAVSGTSIYVGGDFQSTATFGGTSLTSAGFYDGFVTKLTDLGASAGFSWTQPFGGSRDDVVNGLVLSAANIFVTGSFAGPTATFGPITLTNSSTTGTLTYNGYVAKLTDAGTSGSYVWAYDIASPNGSIGHQVAVTGTSVYLAGTLTNSATFGGITKTSAGGADAFLAKLQDGGNTATFNWVQTVGGTGNEVGNGLALVGTAVYLTGNFVSTATFGPTTLTSNGGTNGFVLKCTDAGASSTVGWVQQLGGTDNMEAYGMTAIGTNIYVAGWFSGNFVAGNTAFTASGSKDVFVTKLTDGGGIGTVAWSQRAGSGGADQALTITVTSSGSLYVCGSAVTPAVFGPLVLGGASGNQTGFLASLTDPTVTATVTNQELARVQVEVV